MLRQVDAATEPRSGGPESSDERSGEKVPGSEGSSEDEHHKAVMAAADKYAMYASAFGRALHDKRDVDYWAKAEMRARKALKALVERGG